MTSQSPTRTMPLVKPAKHSKSLKKQEKELEREKKVINAAKAALSEFEGHRLPAVTEKADLFNPRYQVLAGAHASIRRMKSDSLMTHRQQGDRGDNHQSESKWSIDYQYFETSANDSSEFHASAIHDISDVAFPSTAELTKSSIGNVTSNSSGNYDTNSFDRLEVIGLENPGFDGSDSESICSSEAAKTPNYEKEHLSEYDVNLSVTIPSDEFYKPDYENDLNISLSKSVKTGVTIASEGNSRSSTLVLPKHRFPSTNPSPRNIQVTEDTCLDSLKKDKVGTKSQESPYAVIYKVEKSLTFDDTPVTNIDDLITMEDVSVPSDDETYSSSSLSVADDNFSYRLCADTPL